MKNLTLLLSVLISQLVFANADLIDGKIHMPTAVLTNTRTTMPGADSPIQFKFISETSVYHSENKTSARTEVKDCSLQEGDTFFDKMFEQKIMQNIRRLQQSAPALELVVEIDYQLFQHQDFYHSKVREARVILKNGPSGNTTKVLRLPHLPVSPLECNCEIAADVEVFKNVCRSPDYSQLIELLEKLN